MRMERVHSTHPPCSIPEWTSPSLRDLLIRMLKRNAKDRIEYGERVHVHACAHVRL